MFTCVRNKGPRPLSIPYFGGGQEELSLSPYGVVWLRDKEAWDTSKPSAYNLAQAVRDNRVEIVEMAEMPRELTLPNMAKSPAVTPRDMADMYTILIAGDDDTALRIINVRAITGKAGREPDKEYLTKRLLPVLKGALEVYKGYENQILFPGKVLRQREINKRIKELEKR